MHDGYFLFFTPEAGVFPHFATQALIARILKEKGYNVLFVRCHGIYPHCPVMDMYLLSHDSTEENQKKVCGPCQDASNTVLTAYGLESVDLKDFLSIDIVEKVHNALENLPQDFRDFKFDGIPFGTLTVIDLVLATKVSDFAGLSEEMRGVWKKYIANALLSYHLTLEIIKNIPIRGIVHHEDYGLLLAARVAGEKHSIPSIHVGFTGQLGGDRRLVYLMHKAGSGDEQKTMMKWPEWRELSLPPSVVHEPMDDLLGRLGSNSARVYSPKKTFDGKDLYSELGIPRDKILLTAFTSSLDERLAVDSVVDALNNRMVIVKQPFRDQIEWLQALIDYVGNHDEYHLVVRVHPREGANKRENKISQHLVQLKKAFERPLPHATFVWPGMEVSSYDLAELSDLVLTAWTTLGLEVSRVAVPVMASTYSLAPRPNDDFQVWAPTPEAYFAKLEEMVRQPPRMDPVLHAFRWHMVQYMGHTVNLSDIIPTRDYHGIPKFFMPAAAGDVVDVLVNRKDMLDIKRMRLEALQKPDSLSAEREAVRVQLRRALRFLFTGDEQCEDYRLILLQTDSTPGTFLEKMGLTKLEPGATVVLMHGKNLHFLEREKAISRVSAMGVRLAVLGCDSAYKVTYPLPSEAKTIYDEAELRLLIKQASGERDGAEPAFVEASRLKESGKIAEALHVVAKAVENGCASADLFNLQGHLECLSGRMDVGKKIFEKVVASWPNYAKAHNNLSVLHWNDGEKSQALLHLAQGLKADPYCRDLVMNSVRIFKALGENEQAVAISSFYLKKNPEDSAALASLLESQA